MEEGKGRGDEGLGGDRREVKWKRREGGERGENE